MTALVQRMKKDMSCLLGDWNESIKGCLTMINAAGHAYDAAEGKGDVVEEEYFENCEWHIRALFEGERKCRRRSRCSGRRV